MAKMVTCPSCKGYKKVFIETFQTFKSCIVCKSTGRVTEETKENWVKWNNKTTSPKSLSVEDLEIKILLQRQAQKAGREFQDLRFGEANEKIKNMEFSFKLED